MFPAGTCFDDFEVVPILVAKTVKEKQSLFTLLSVSSIPYCMECMTLGYPESWAVFPGNDKRDGWLRSAVKAHVTVCSGWAVSQSQASRGSRGGDRSPGLDWTGR